MRYLATLLLTLVMLPGCGNLHNLAAKSRAKKDRKQLEKLIETSAGEASARLGDKAVGEIVSVAADEQFVLLKLLNGVNLPTDTELETRRNGTRSGLLKMTPEKNRMFNIADLTEGSPEVGDSVYPTKQKPSFDKPGTLSASGKPAPAGMSTAPVPLEALPLLPPPATGQDDFNPKNLPPLPGRVEKPEDVIQKRH